MRRAARGDEELERVRPVPPPQLARQLERDEGSHAVAEECKRYAEVRCEGIRECAHQSREAREGRLPEPVVAAGELDRAHVDVRGQFVRPAGEVEAGVEVVELG